MKNVLVIGAAGQIGSELVPALIKEGCFTVAGFTRTPLSSEVKEGGPSERVDITPAHKQWQRVPSING